MVEAKMANKYCCKNWCALRCWLLHINVYGWSVKRKSSDGNAKMPGDSVKMLRYELFFNEVLKMPLLLWQQGGHLTTAQFEISQDIKANFGQKKGCEFRPGTV